MSQQFTIPSVEDIIVAQTMKKLSSVFECQVFAGSAEERLHLLRKSNKAPNYPYMFLSLDRMSRFPGRYNSALVGRYGVTSFTENNIEYRVRLMPTLFNFTVEFITNDFNGTHGVSQFAKRWVFAGRNGYLKFNVRYGAGLVLPLHMELDEDVNVGELSNKAESAPEYNIRLNLIVEGFVSENQLSPVGQIQELEFQSNLELENQKGEFWGFPQGVKK